MPNQGQVKLYYFLLTWITSFSFTRYDMCQCGIRLSFRCIGITANATIPVNQLLAQFQKISILCLWLYVCCLCHAFTSARIEIVYDHVVPSINGSLERNRRLRSHFRLCAVVAEISKKSRCFRWDKKENQTTDIWLYWDDRGIESGQQHIYGQAESKFIFHLLRLKIKYCYFNDAKKIIDHKFMACKTGVLTVLDSWN